jgi:anti-sigma-K factor RskA
MTRDNWHDMVDGYVLDALEPDERTAFEARLAVDAELTRSVDEARVSLLGLAEALPHAAPPVGLKARLLERARAERPAGAPALPLPSQEGKAAAARPAGATRAIPWVLLAASVAGLVWLGTSNVRATREADSLAGELADARAALAASQQSLEAAETALARFDSLALALTGSDLRFANLTGDAAPGLRLFWNRDRAVMLVAAENLPSAPPGRTFQIWGIRGTDAPVSLGTFDTGPTGSALLTLPVESADYDLGALTEEPLGGSPQPTTTPFLVGPWSAAGG